VTFAASTGPWREVRSPNDDAVVTTVQDATGADVDRLLGETPEAQRTVSRLRPFERAEILRAVARELREREREFARTIAAEGGKPLKDALVEARRAAATIDLCAEETLRLDGDVIPMERTPAGRDHLSFTLRDPIGRVLAISAFNHPLNLIAHQVGCAVAAGCAVVLKPAPATPVCAELLRQIFLRAGLPGKGLRVVNADVPLVQKLAADPAFGYVSFIGSARVGWELRKLLAPGTRLALEHGGQAPAIVRADADLDAAAAALVKGAFYHAGQVCISTQGIFVHESVFDPFLEKFTRATGTLVVGSALDEATDVGPLIRPAEVVRLRSWIDEAIAAGAVLVTGNTVSGTRGQYLAPTVLRDVPRDLRIMAEEAFGPVVCVNRYADEDELLDWINARDYVFEAALFTRDLTRALRIAREISTMTFVINNHTAFRVDQMPFGGHRKSGLGMGGVRYAIEEMTRLKQIIIKA
jgi:acyl-CoA reductase-like NAD-dependent aldehyde dehydrogenase